MKQVRHVGWGGACREEPATPKRNRFCNSIRGYYAVAANGSVSSEVVGLRDLKTLPVVRGLGSRL